MLILAWKPHDRIRSFEGIWLESSNLVKKLQKRTQSTWKFKVHVYWEGFEKLSALSKLECTLGQYFPPPHDLKLLSRTLDNLAKCFSHWTIFFWSCTSSSFVRSHSDSMHTYLLLLVYWYIFFSFIFDSGLDWMSARIPVVVLGFWYQAKNTLKRCDWDDFFFTVLGMGRVLNQTFLWMIDGWGSAARGSFLRGLIGSFA